MKNEKDLDKSIDLERSLPNDIRLDGWTVAVHNDYKQHGILHTFWLFTKNGKAVKGEGKSDAEALDEVRKQIFSTEE